MTTKKWRLSPCCVHCFTRSQISLPLLSLGHVNLMLRFLTWLVILIEKMIELQNKFL